MSSLCLDCRAALDHGERCETSGHTTVSLLDPDDRDLALRAAWVAKKNVESVREDAARLVVLLGSFAVGGVLMGTLQMAVTDAIELVPVVGAGVASTGIYFAVTHRAKKLTFVPVGTSHAPPKTRGASVRGVARGGVHDAGDGGPSGPLGFALTLEVTSRGGSGPTLVLARSRGFVIETDDGRAIEVPAGRARIVGAAAGRVDADLEVVRAAVRHIDPGRAADELPAGRDPVPWDRATLIAIRDGDAVELFGELAPARRSEAPDDPTGYRDGALSRLQVLGVPTLRV